MNFKPGLYIVSTPIGNLQDITLRAIETLKYSNYILCEDTRVTQKLLAKINIKSNLLTYNDFSNISDREKVKELINNGAVVSLVSDAGTPLISDPGFKLIRELKNLGYYINIAPGPCSPIAALILSGLPTDKFYFGGFVPKTDNSRASFFSEILNLKATLIFFETAPRLVDTLQMALKIFGDREACIARELTKLYQETNTNLLSLLVKDVSLRSLKGEIVLLINGFQKEEHIQSEELLNKIKLLRCQYSAKDIVNIIYEELKDKYKLSKTTLYDMVKTIEKE